MFNLSYLFETKQTCLKIKNKFLIHEHKANRAGLHYDLRIEHNCKLESFATRKIADLINNKTKKIMLFRQPIHEPEWFDFESEIGQGYGSGKLKMWDKGSYKTIKWEDDGNIVLDFSGSRLIGTFAIIPYNLEKKQYLMLKTN